MHRAVLRVVGWTVICVAVAVTAWSASAQTPPPGIWQAAYEGDLAALQAELDRDPGLLDQADAEYGATPLHWAALGGRLDVVEGLLAAGACVALQDAGWQTARSIAEERGWTALADALGRAEADMMLRLSAPPHPDLEVGLDTLDVTSMTCGWGAPAPGRSVNGTPISLGGHSYAGGVGAHADSEYFIPCAERYARFSSVVGIDDSTHGAGEAEFGVVADGVLVARSGILRGGDGPRLLTADLRGRRKVCLIVDQLGDHTCDVADWAGARLLKGPLWALGDAADRGELSEAARLVGAGRPAGGDLTLHDVATEAGDARLVAALSEVELWDAPQAASAPAPDVTLTDTRGRVTSLVQLRGKVVALLFFVDTDWIRPAPPGYLWLDVAQTMQRSEAVARGDLAVVGVTSLTPDAADAFMQKHQYTFPVVSDPDDTVRAALGQYALPAVVLDRDGCIAWSRRMFWRTPTEESGLRLAVARTLAGAPRLAPEPDESDAPREEVVLADFESGYAGWTLSGGCWGGDSSSDAQYPGLVKGYCGRGFVNTMGARGMELTGMAVSAPFEIARRYIHLLIGGSDLPDHCALCLVVDGKAVRRATGENSAELRPTTWDVGDLVGRTARLEIIDAGTVEMRDYVLVDEIIASDSASLPERYADRFDPDDPDDSRREYAEFPEWYQMALEGQVHTEIMPGPTYEWWIDGQLRWPDGPTDWLEARFSAPPSHFAQTVQDCVFRVEGSRGAMDLGAPEALGRPVRRSWVTYLSPESAPARTITFHSRGTIIPHAIQLCPGPPVQPVADIPVEARAALTAPYGSLDHSAPEVQELLDRLHLRRHPSETDIQFLMRVFRHFQRYQYSTGIGVWGGWPTSFKHPVAPLVSRSCDCGLGATLALVARANGIPAFCGQGGWLQRDGSTLGAHVRPALFARDVGWLWFDAWGGVSYSSDQFRYGFYWGNGFIDLDPEDAPETAGPDAPAGAVLHAWAEHPDWYRSRLLNEPSLEPVVANADMGSYDWLATERAPGADWSGGGQASPGWMRCGGGFGTNPTRERPVATEWTGGELWARATFDLPQDGISALRLRLLVDGEIEVFVNGVLTLLQPDPQGWAGPVWIRDGDPRPVYPLSTEAQRGLRPTGNVLAFHCKGTYADVGLVDVRP